MGRGPGRGRGRGGGRGQMRNIVDKDGMPSQSRASVTKKEPVAQPSQEDKQTDAIYREESVSSDGFVESDDMEDSLGYLDDQMTAAQSRLQINPPGRPGPRRREPQQDTRPRKKQQAPPGLFAYVVTLEKDRPYEGTEFEALYVLQDLQHANNAALFAYRKNASWKRLRITDFGVDSEYDESPPCDDEKACKWYSPAGEVRYKWCDYGGGTVAVKTLRLMSEFKTSFRDDDLPYVARR